MTEETGKNLNTIATVLAVLIDAGLILGGSFWLVRIKKKGFEKHKVQTGVAGLFLGFGAFRAIKKLFYPPDFRFDELAESDNPSNPLVIMGSGATQNLGPIVRPGQNKSNLKGYGGIFG
jgi:hypothetical protein